MAADASRSSPGEVVTARLRVVPATVDLARAEVRAPGALGELLGATVPDDWPPETVGDAVEWLAGRLEERPEDAGWMHWYAVAGTDRTAIVVGSVGFFGPPEAGAVEIGYAVLPQFQRQGYGSEMVGALVDWALADPEVGRVVAETDAGNGPSIRLLERIGFSRVGPGREPGSIRFEHRS